MRLVCPNCEAKYEVPEDAIPETGRDVQCANCGHAWFQMRPRAAVAETVAAPVVPPAPVVESEPEPEPEPVVAVAEEVSVAGEAPAETEAPVAEPPLEETPEVVAEEPVVDEVAAVGFPEVEDAADVTSLTDPVPEAVAVEVAAEVANGAPEAEAEAEAEVSDLAAAAAVPAAYAVDDSVLAILREEAEREAQARRAEVAKPLETQTDLGIDSAIPASRRSAETVVPVAAVAEVEADDKLVHRHRLPDVEEINSTLRPAESAQDGVADGAPVIAEGRSSFRSGFLLVMTVAILGAAIYGAADAIASAVPALAGTLKAYVGFVDSLRLQLDGLMQSATVAINGNEHPKSACPGPGGPLSLAASQNREEPS